MKKLLPALIALPLLFAGSSAFAQTSGASTPPANCPPLSTGVLRDGTVSCAYVAKVESNGSLDVNVTAGGGGSGASYTAAAAPFSVSAGTNKPAGIDTANSAQYTELVIPGTTTTVDPTAPSKLVGLDGATLMSTANALAAQLQTQTDTTMVGGVNLKEVNAVTVLTGAGATGTGSQRVTVAQDTTTIAGSAPGTAGTASANVVTVQGIASMTKLLVTPDALPANQSVNVNQFGGSAVVTGTGVGGAGIPRVTLSSDSSLAANQSVNTAQVNGVTTSTGTGAVGTGTQRVAVGTDTATIAGSSPTTALAAAGAGATGSAVPSNGVYNSANVGGNLTGLIACGSSVVYDASTNGKTQLVALSSGKVTYVCGYTIFAAGTVNVSLSTGTGTNCGSTSTNITPAFQLTAQTGAVDGSPFYRGLATTASQELCLVTSAGVAVQALVYYTQF